MKLARLMDPRFHAVFAKLSKQPLPLKVAFKLKGIQNKIQEEMKKFEEVRLAALEKFGPKGEDGKLVADAEGNIQLTGENAIAFSKELNELSSTELDLATIKLDELGEKVELSAEEVGLLGELLVE